MSDLSKDYFALNAMLNLYDADGKIQFDKDKEAARIYFREHVNQNMVWFHDLEEKVKYLIEEGYYEDFFGQYSWDFVKATYKRAYGYKFRFATFVSAYKFYSSYALRTWDRTRYLERYEDRVAVVALYLAQGDEFLASDLVDQMMSGRYQPATPTFLNSGRAKRGDLVSCFLLRVEDDLDSIARSWTNAAQLSKRGGGVALCLTNLRASGDDLAGQKGIAKGIVPWMKQLENVFSAVDQMGQRPGAGAVYLSVHHPDILTFLDTRRENADEKIRIKTLSLGVVIPDVTYHLAAKDDWLHAFSPYDVQQVYGRGLGDIDITAEYARMMDDDRIRKVRLCKARDLFTTIAEVQFESGYPYILNEDIANRANPVSNLGRIQMSNLCSEILQPSIPSALNEDGTYSYVGQDISCNLGSMNIAKVMEARGYWDPIGAAVEPAIRALSAVATMTDMRSVPSVKRGNDLGRSIGLGQMNLHGYLQSVGIAYGSEESVDFVRTYFAAVAFAAITTSHLLAREHGMTFDGFLGSDYANGKYFEKYTTTSYRPRTPKVTALFDGMWLPDTWDWAELSDQVAQYGMYNRHLQAVPPTGSISYINNSTSSIHPITSKVEIREEGKMGRVYYPAFGLTNENSATYADAYEIGWKGLIDVYAAAQEHVDQGLSLTLFMKEEHTTRDFNQAQIYAWSKGIKTIYYVRVREQAIEGTDSQMCVSCAL